MAVSPDLIVLKPTPHEVIPGHSESAGGGKPLFILAKRHRFLKTHSNIANYQKTTL